ncbi:hypothetical protein QBC46DRAFT_98927 [Diplogelasinospora grovesii]|uniref:Transmembrane protein n=1 Tax=Diplogelasinospora grovesii TaxID=303347 RepID=A0AAN6S6C5_9PEZI|nr:hypothetical protein QBC46DRAFT_98927 [Diplogelasinospora grovesii]
MAATSTGYFPLATEDPYTGPDSSTPTDGSAAGASGSSQNSSFQLSRGGLIAIIVVVVFVTVFGIGSAVLFFVAKKREWKVRETMRKSMRKVVTALTPRRSEFPKSVKESSGGGRGGGRSKLNDVPPTPRIPKHLDLEKGSSTGSLDDNKPAAKKSKFANFSRK